MRKRHETAAAAPTATARRYFLQRPRCQFTHTSVLVRERFGECRNRAPGVWTDIGEYLGCCPPDAPALVLQRVGQSRDSRFTYSPERQGRRPGYPIVLVA